MVISRSGGMSSSDDILALVRTALYEFDSIPLEATVRRSVRIANLLGDTRSAVRLGYELKAAGGHPPANAEATRRLMQDPSSWGSPNGVAELALNDYMAERDFGDGQIIAFGIAEFEFFQSERLDKKEMTDEQYGKDLKYQAKIVEILARIRHLSFTILCAWERQLTFSANQATALDAVSRRVDRLLSERAPDVLGQFNAAFKRLRESANAEPESSVGEELSQALASCRRILKAIVDIVQPADPGNPVSVGGHSLGDQQYRNRLMEYLKRVTDSGTFRAALSNGGEALFERFGAVDTLSSKGVHARVAFEEAEYCALHTYLMVGEILLIQQDVESSQASSGGVPIS